MSSRSLHAPWHEGELAMQRRAGVVDRMDAVGRNNIRDHMIEQHRSFFGQLRFVILGAVDPEGDAWATILAGRPGFLDSPHPATLHVATRRDTDDPANAGLRDGAAVALLGIEPRTRRRNRMNGHIDRMDDSGFDVLVAQSYGNCPQYIRQRQESFARDPDGPAPSRAEHLAGLDDRCRAMIAAADTFFIASYVDGDDGRRQVDVSHRGGRPGFVRLGTDRVLTLPDFAGNLFFNTLGNISVNAKCGFTFADFETGDLLQLTGDGEVVLDSPEILAFQGAERLIRFTPRQVVLHPGALALRMTPLQDGISPNATLTGTWPEAESRLDAVRLSTTWRRFSIRDIVEESASIRSLYLTPVDGAGLVPHKAGQHLPIRVTLKGALSPSVRTYTLSSAPSDETYRISVKREGEVSRHLHALNIGDMLEAKAPAGTFTIDARETRPAVLLAAGVGITPLLAMLRHLVYEGLRTRRMRPTTIFYAARSEAERAFDLEIAELQKIARGAFRIVRALSDVAGLEPQHYEARRIDIALLRATLGFDDYDFYVCGPGSFMQAIYDGLRDLDVSDARIHAEAFGPAALRRRGVAGSILDRPPSAAIDPVGLIFAASGSEAVWTPGSGFLLDLAEANGLAPAYSCRVGSCGTCRTRVLEGSITYPTPPSAASGANEALICCAVPALGSESGVRLDL